MANLPQDDGWKHPRQPEPVRSTGWMNALIAIMTLGAIFTMLGLLGAFRTYGW